MALFKIFNNIDSGNSLPTTAAKGYCYFDASTKLFWIDIKDTPDNYTLPSDQNSTEYREYRVPLNSYISSYATRAYYDENGNSLNPMNSKGDLVYGTKDSNNHVKYTRLAIGTSGQVLKASANGTPEWGEIVALPKGGTAGQYLIKSSATDGDAAWQTISASEVIGATATGSATKPVYWNGSAFATITSYEGKSATAGTADKVANSLKLKFDSGTTEGTDLFTFNGSNAKTINIVGGTNVSIDDSVSGTISLSSPSLSGGVASSNDKKIISGISVSGHAITTTQKTINVDDGLSISDNGSTISISHTNSTTAKTSQALYPIKINSTGHITSTGTAVTALKNPNALTVGSKNYDGSAAVTITAADLGLASALRFIGIATVGIVDGGTTDPIIEGYTFSNASVGDVVIDADSAYEFMWNGSAWERLGPDASYALNTVSISAGTGLTGGGNLTQNRTISANLNSKTSIGTLGNDNRNYAVGVDNNGKLAVNVPWENTEYTLDKQSDTVLGNGTTFTASSSSVSFGTHLTDWALGADTVFDFTNPTITVTPTNTNIKATASGCAVSTETAEAITSLGSASTATVLKSYSGTSSKMATTTVKGVKGTVDVPNITAVGSVPELTYAATAPSKITAWSQGSLPSMSYTNGSAPSLTTSYNSTTEELEISWSAGTMTTVSSFSQGSLPSLTYAAEASSKVSSWNAGSAPTLGTAITVATAADNSTTVATGSLSATATGAAVMTGLGTATTETVVTGYSNTSKASFLNSASISAQPTISLATGATKGTGVISVTTGIASATATGGAVSASGDQVEAITGIGTATAAAQRITIGTNDTVEVLLSTTALSEKND